MYIHIRVSIIVQYMQSSDWTLECHKVVYLVWCCTPSQYNTSIITFADDTTVIGLIAGGNEVAGMVAHSI